jgi:hypothetical protein
MSETVMSGLDILTMFVMLFPKDFIENVFLVETHKMIEGDPVTFGEFLQFVGIWLYMSTTAGYSRSD